MKANRFRNFNTVGSTAGAPAIDTTSRNSHTRPTLVGGHTNRKADVLIVVALVLAMIFFTERAAK